MKLSVIIPIFNEIHTLEEIITRVQATGIPSEIVLVDDGSSDDTWSRIRELSASDIVNLIGRLVRSKFVSMQRVMLVVHEQ